jgi:hypothetical protein
MPICVLLLSNYCTTGQVAQSVMSATDTIKKRMVGVCDGARIKYKLMGFMVYF